MEPSYAELRAQINELEEQARKAHEVEVRAAIDEIREKMRIYGITVEQLEEQSGKRTRAKAKPKYRDPATGVTWSGRGRAPAWFDPERAADFAIER